MKRLTPNEISGYRVGFFVGPFNQLHLHRLLGHIAAIEQELAEANRDREFGYKECVKHLEELAESRAWHKAEEESTNVVISEREELRSRVAELEESAKLSNAVKLGEMLEASRARVAKLEATLKTIAEGQTDPSTAYSTVCRKALESGGDEPIQATAFFDDFVTIEDFRTAQRKQNESKKDEK